VCRIARRPEIHDGAFDHAARLAFAKADNVEPAPVRNLADEYGDLGRANFNGANILGFRSHDANYAED